MSGAKGNSLSELRRHIHMLDDSISVLDQLDPLKRTPKSSPQHPCSPEDSEIWSKICYALLKIENAKEHMEVMETEMLGQERSKQRGKKARARKKREARRQKQGTRREADGEESPRKRRRNESLELVRPGKQAKHTTRTPPQSFLNALSTHGAAALWYALPEDRHAPALSYLQYAEKHFLPTPYLPVSASHVSGWIAYEAEQNSFRRKRDANLAEALSALLDGLESWHLDLGFRPVVTQRARAVVAGAATWWG